MLDSPFFASSVANLPFVAASEFVCGTMATDGVRIFYNPDWCDSLSDSDLDFVVKHELLHCLLGHIDRRLEREVSLWNIAIDFATNGLLVTSGLRMPEMGLFDIKFVGLSAESIYDHLYERYREVGAGDYESFIASFGNHLDLHLDPDGSSSELFKLYGITTAEERRRLRSGLLLQAQNEGWGRMSEYVSQEIEVSTSSRIHWNQLLAAFVTGLRQVDYRMFPFNKKHIWRGLCLPSLGVPGPSHLVIAIDTSGSMSSNTISKILGEISSLRSSANCVTTIIQCDAAVQDVRRFEAFEELDRSVEIIGRGGTSFEPVFDFIKGKILEPIDALVYLTDGFGDCPINPVDYPVLWVLTSNGRKPCDWGEEIRMPADI